MDHFTGITPQERFNNELLQEIKETNNLLRQLLGHNAQVTEVVELNKPRRGRRKAANQ